MHGRRFAALLSAAPCETSEVKVSPHALAVQVGHRNSRACRSASACETLDSNVRGPLPHGFVAVYVFGSGGGDFGLGVETRLVVSVVSVPVPPQSSSPALRSASACETYEVTVCPQARAVHFGRGGAGQLQARAWRFASACETLDVK